MFTLIHRSVDGAGLSRKDIPDLAQAKQIADDYQRRADQSIIDCSCHGDGCASCHGDGCFYNPWRYEYVVFDQHGGRRYETRSVT